MTPETDARETLLAAVDGIAEKLAGEWLADEAAATLSDSSVETLTASGLFTIKLPRVLGGYEADPVTQMLVFEALAEVNPSASWCTMVGATAVGAPGAFLPDEAIAEIFSGPKPPRGALVVMPAGKTVAAEGGWRLSGRWPFVSGVRHADWITTGAMIPLQGDGPPTHCMLTFPAAHAQIHDNWQVAGLKGTGSCDISVDDLFVPDSFVWDLHNATPQRGGALYHIRFPGFVANEHAGFALGTARRALRAFLEIAAKGKRGTASPTSLAARPAIQRMLAEAEFRLRATRMLAIELNEEAWQTVQRGDPISGHQQAALRAVAAYCTEVAVDLVSQAFRFAGGRAIYEGNLLQQCLRDINVAAQHILVSEIAYENLGQFILGLPDASARR